MTRIFTLMIIAISAVSIGVPLSAQTDSTFTYQGELQENGNLANGIYAFYVRPWDSEYGGTAVHIGNIVFPEVVDGKFSIDLDFGAEVFDGSDRWLELFVNGESLWPRQLISRAPYAVQTRGMVVGDEGNVLFNSLNQAEGTVTVSSPGGIDLILDADTNDVGEDQNARIVLKQDGGLVVGRVGYREGANDLEIMQEYNGDLVLGTNNESRVTISSVLHVKQDISNRGIRTEHEATPEYWDTGIGFVTRNYKFFYNDASKADISSVDGAYIIPSDRRLKRDTQPIPPVLEKVSQLMPATYLYIDNPENTPRSYGFVAQEVEPLFPNLVRESDDGTKGLVYDGFAVISIRAIQELHDKNLQLEQSQALSEQKLAGLEQANSELRTRLESLEQIVQQLASTEPEKTK